jgi:phosphate transport system ATP-binding protein
VADHCAFFLQGQLVEYGLPDQIFINPKDERTGNYVEGRFG